MKIQYELALTLFGFSPFSVCAATHYVWQGSPSPAPPYTNWASAATNIQDAVDVAVASEEIVVTNGIYRTGGRVGSSSTNRVAVTKPLTLRSVNGAEVTVIDGLGTVRCVYLTNGAALVGFTLTNGYAPSECSSPGAGGGAYCDSTNAVLSNCVLSGNSAGLGGGAYGGTLNNCSLEGNQVGQLVSGCSGAGAPSEGYVGSGGGAHGSTLNSCTLTGNSAYFDGGGASGSTLNDCTLTGNSASYSGYESYGGGGAYDCTLKNCTVSGNSAPEGGGVYGSGLNSCVLSGNSASFGGGAASSRLNHCTLTGNSAERSGGGAYDSALNNSILYYNTALLGANYSFPPGFVDPGSLNYCCTTPLPATGNGNISAEPQLASSCHISLGSPCTGAGSLAFTVGVDIDGETWADPPSIGCDEVHPGAETGPLTVALKEPFTNIVKGCEVLFTAQINGHATANRWEFGDGTVLSNRAIASHAWAEAGDCQLIVRVYNQTYPDGVSAAVTVSVTEAQTNYVVAGSATPVAPYLTWATAATNIQEAVDAAAVGAVVLVSNGVYQAGGRVVGATTNRVVITKPLTVLSVKGPEVTAIDGLGLVRCVYLGSEAVVVGFTLTNGLADYGGGSYGGTLNNCILAGNQAVWSGPEYPIGYAGSGGGAKCSSLNSCILRGNAARYFGGGAYRCTLNRCVLAGNLAFDCGWALGPVAGGEGGGACESMLYNCTVTGNSAGAQGGGVSACTVNNSTLSGNSAAHQGCFSGILGPHPCGGGAAGSTLNNCIIYFNTADVTGDNEYGSNLDHCCTTPLSTSGLGNIDADPALRERRGGRLSPAP